MRHFPALAIALTASLLLPASAAAQLSSGLISQAEARRHGLERAWVTHAAVDRSRDRLANLTLDGPNLFVQSNKSLLQSLDAETGARIWTVQVGHRDYPSSPPAANEKYVAVVNGSTLYVLDRATGQTIREQKLRWVPSGSVALAENWVYVPTLNSQLEVFGLEDPNLKWNCGSAGYIDMPPLVARKALVWGTSKGYVNFASPSRGEINFRLQTNGPVSAPMSYWPPMVLAASRDGYLYAIHEQTGDTIWRFSLGTAVNEAPVAIDGSVYVVSEEGGVHCLACADGEVRWYSVKATRVLAVTPTHVYATDRLGNTLVLDAQTGGHMDTLTTWQLPVKHTNIQNDRLYYGSATGLLMCFRDASLAQPIQHQLPPELKPAESGGAGDMPMPTDPAAAPAENPFGAQP
jgi:outer membrane protein assembly factor BamB